MATEARPAQSEHVLLTPARPWLVVGTKLERPAGA